jgi:hypothetical protein
MGRKSKKYGLKEPTKAPKDVVDLAEQVRKKHHPDLEGAKIGYVMLPGRPSNKGKTILGRCKKIGRGEALFCEVDFIVGFPKDSWDTLDDRQKIAVADHELCHCGNKLDKDGKARWCIIPHDVEEFSLVVKRHGLYLGDQTEFAQQMSRAYQATLQFEKVKPRQNKEAAG